MAAALRETTDADAPGTKRLPDSPDLTNMQVIAFTTTKEVGKHAILQQVIVACIIRDDMVNASVIQYPRVKALNIWIAEHYGASHTPHQVFVVPTDAVQRLSHGKIDRRALEKLLIHDTGGSNSSMQGSTTNENATSTLEKMLATILKETLDVELQGEIPDEVQARTFGELGANSLLATLIVYELNKIFGAHSVKSHELVRPVLILLSDPAEYCTDPLIGVAFV